MISPAIRVAKPTAASEAPTPIPMFLVLSLLLLLQEKQGGDIVPDDCDAVCKDRNTVSDGGDVVSGD